MKNNIRIKSHTIRIIFWIILWVTFSISIAVPAQSVYAQKRVLVLHSYHDGLSWTHDLRKGINKGFQKLDQNVEVIHEFLDAKNHPELKYGHDLLEIFERKYKDRPIDLVMVSDDPGLRLILEHRKLDEFWNNLPVVFLGVNKVDQNLMIQPNMVGVFELLNITESVLGALKQTKMNRIIVINDTTITGQGKLGGLEKLRLHPSAPEQINILNDLVPNQIEQVFKNIPKQLPVFIMGQLRKDAPDGPLLGFDQTAQVLRNKIKNPLFTDGMVFIGHGAIGGKVLNAETHALQAVQLAAEVLSGVPIDTLTSITEAETTWVYDWEQLKRFKIDIDSLPSESKFINKTPSFYEQNKPLVWLTSAAFLTALLIIFLLADVIRRRAASAKYLQENQQRYKDFSEAGDNVFWELDRNLNFKHVSDNDMDDSGLLAENSFADYIQGRVDSIPQLEFNRETFLELVNAHQPIRDFICRTHVGDEAIQIHKFNGTPLFDESGAFKGYRGIRREITKEHNLAETIAYQAHYDSLTGLINRGEFDAHLQKTIEANGMKNQQAVLCYIDLDQFKFVNDSVGHTAGDRLLKELTSVLKKCIRETDTLGRLGGDEFGLILTPTSLHAAETKCQQIIDTIRDYRFEWQGRLFNLGCSIGLIPILDDASDAVDYLMRADVACYKAKDLGRNCFYSDVPGNKELLSHKIIMTHISNISQAIKNKKFSLFEQKILNIANPNTSESHFEVLLRFENEDSRYGSPQQLIIAAERYGVISSIDIWVLETVIKRCAEVHQDALVSVNISGLSLGNEKFIEKAFSLIENADFPVSRLCFEITETAAISRIDDATKFITRMKALGVKFALDDFGSGQSSFGYLNALSVDFLKIDGSLVKNIVHDASKQVMVRSINEIAHIMGMKTIAEFVEDQDILDCLEKIGVDYAQGYGIAKPKLLPLKKLPVQISDLAYSTV